MRANQLRLKLPRWLMFSSTAWQAVATWDLWCLAAEIFKTESEGPSPRRGACRFYEETLGLTVGQNGIIGGPNAKSKG
jgi:hypothetical protein